MSQVPTLQHLSAFQWEELMPTHLLVPAPPTQLQSHPGLGYKAVARCILDPAMGSDSLGQRPLTRVPHHASAVWCANVIHKRSPEISNRNPRRQKYSDLWWPCRGHCSGIFLQLESENKAFFKGCIESNEGALSIRPRTAQLEDNNLLQPLAKGKKPQARNACRACPKDPKPFLQFLYL